MWTAAGAKHLIVRRYTAIWSPNILTGVTIGETISEKREAILRIAAKHGATQVRLIGSVARWEARPDSDVDLLVTWQDGTSLLARRHSSWSSRACWAQKSIYPATAGGNPRYGNRFTGTRSLYEERPGSAERSSGGNRQDRGAGRGSLGL